MLDFFLAQIANTFSNITSVQRTHIQRTIGTNLLHVPLFSEPPPSTGRVKRDTLW